MQQSSSSDFLVSRKRDDLILAGLVVLAIVVGLYAAATVGTTEFLVSGTLFALAGLLTIRGHRLTVAARSKLSDLADRQSLAAQVEEVQVNYQSIFNNALEGLFQSTPEGSFITANPAMARMLGQQPFHAVTFGGRRYDCGSKTGFVEATLSLALERPDMADEVRAIAQRLLAE